ncbi:caspase family protein [Mucilaginibacter sp.]|uniref:caspase family protein n=1 Tax=Mucilaginibacter sp. TaxID=1882438 RepID=UPI00260059E8|nr:caspase family protein [Mucilaginibacter sp.]
MKLIFTFLLAIIISNAVAQKLELRIPIAHTGYVQAVAISPDDKYIATGASDKSVKIWSIANGMQLKTLQLSDDVQGQLKFSADKRHLTVRMESGWEYWDMLAGKMEYEFLRAKMKGDYKIGIIISTDGTMAAVVSAGTIMIRNTADGTLLKTINWKAPDPDGSFNINNIKFNKKYIAIVEGGKLLVYNIDNSAALQFEQPDAQPDQIGLAPDNNELYVNGKTKLYKVNLDTRLVTVLEEKTITVDAVSFSNNGKYVLMSPRRVIDRATNQELHYFFEMDYNVIVAASEKYFVFFDRETSDGHLYAMENFEKLRDLKNETARLQLMTVNTKTNQLIFTTAANEARFWNIGSYRFEKTIPFATKEGSNRYSSAFGDQGDYYLSGNFSQQTVVNINTGSVLTTSDKGVKSISPDGTIGFIEKAGAGNIINLTSGTVIKTIGLTYPRYFASPDNQTVVYQHYPDARVNIYNYRANTEITAEVQVGDYPIFNSAGNKLYSVNVLHDQGPQSPSLITTSVSTGRQLAKIPLLEISGMRVNKFAISPDEKYVAVSYRTRGDYYMSKNNMLIVYEFATGKEVSRAGDILGADEISFLGNNYLVALMSEITNMVQIYDGVTARHLVDLAHFKGLNDWIAVTPDGLYDGNMESLKKFYFVRGNEFVDPGAYFEKFYTPNLFARIVAGEKFAPVDVNIKAVPKVKISYKQIYRNLNVVDDKVPAYTNTTGIAEITVNASAENDKIDEIRLFHNGKIVNLATRGLFVTDNTTGTDSKKYTLNLLPGVNNIRAVALNSQRTESVPDEIAIRYDNGTAQANTPAKPAANNLNTFIAGIDKDATVHLIVVGINQYKNPKMSLNYALADATAFKEEAERDAATFTANIKTYFITDDKADKAGILQAFKTVQQNAKPQDVLIFYYAGHGVISDKNKEFYLVPTDVADLKNVDEALAEHGIPSKLLQQYAIDISAQKQVFILDACQSAGAFAALMTNDAGKLKSLALVARSTGTHWIAASGSQQFANEFSQLGHGAFTYVLLKAMKGEATSNKMVTVNGLKNYLQVQVPDLMKKYNGTPQYPASYGFGSDFPVQIVK